MNRRSFLSLLGHAAAGATVAYSFPSIIVPKNIQPVALDYPLAYRGLAHLINDRGGFWSVTTASFPDLNSPVVDLNGAVLTPHLFDAAKKRLNTYYYGIGDGSLSW